MLHLAEVFMAAVQAGQHASGPWIWCGTSADRDDHATAGCCDKVGPRPHDCRCASQTASFSRRARPVEWTLNEPLKGMTLPASKG